MIQCLAALALGLQTPITATLEAKLPNDKERLRWSPKGAIVSLKAEDKALVGEFSLGPKSANKIKVKLTKGEGATYFDHLWVDLNRDGQPYDSEILTTTPNERNKKWWSSFGPSSIPIPEAAGKSRPYPLNFWFVFDPAEPTAQPQLRWSRSGWHEGTVQIGGKPAWVLITESNMDGIFDQRDAWFLSRDREGLLKAMSRNLEDHAWLDGVAYRPTAIDADGHTLSFESFNPGVTEAEESQKRDTLAPDREAPRAEKPLSFSHDFAEAEKRARKEGKPLFVDFETSWCGPCKSMDEWVYTAKAVVEAAREIVSVKVDGDEHRDLVKRFKVGAYPTLILIDKSGKEIRRAVGYRSIEEMRKFFEK
ncbi:MAG: thioredoxin family protein [Fimbriimonadaceae bacterium]